MKPLRQSCYDRAAEDAETAAVKAVSSTCLRPLILARSVPAKNESDLSQSSLGLVLVMVSL